MRRTLYRLALRTYPPSFRREFGREMERTAAALAGARGRYAAPLLLADLVTSVPREWCRAAQAFGRARVNNTGSREPSSRGELMPRLVQDVRFALRLLARAPLFTAAAVVTLALGIGANAAFFTLADATILRPLKVQAPEELVTVPWSSAYVDYREYARRDDLFAGVMGSSNSRVTLSMNGSSDLVQGMFVSGNAFSLLGVPPSAGRTLTPADDAGPGSPLVVMLSEPYWRKRFGSDPSAVGSTVRVNGRPAVVIGVAGRDFRGLSLASSPQVFLPLTSIGQVATGLLAQPQILTTRNFVWLAVTARLKPGVTIEQASAGLDTLYRQLNPPKHGDQPERLVLVPLITRALGGRDAPAVRRFVILLVGVVALTLLIGCANLANLLLARATARHREVGVRVALGASRFRIVAQMLVETTVLAGLGGAAGLLVASVALRLIATYQLPGEIPIANLDLGLSTTVVAATAVVAVMAGLVFGAAPAWRASRADVSASLRDGSRGSSARGQVRSALVAVQIALSLVLLTGSGLFLRSLVNALNVPLGFESRSAVTASVNLALVRYDTPRAHEFYRSALERMRALPGVQAAAWSSVIPTKGNMVSSVRVDGYTSRSSDQPMVSLARVSDAYFAAAGTRILQGRGIVATDAASAPAVVVVNETAAQTFWPGRRALGGRLSLSDGKDWFTVVGVAEDAKVSSLTEERFPFAYFPFDQRIGDAMFDQVAAAHLFVRTAGDPAPLTGIVRQQLQALDPDAPVYDVQLFEEHVRDLVMPQRMGVTLFGFFSVLALTLATIGIYAVASYAAALRTKELGIRIALGADARAIGRLVLWQGAAPVAVGMVAGMALAFWAARLTAGFLYGTAPWDPPTFAAVSATIAALSLVASYIPARRAARIDPVSALRQD